MTVRALLGSVVLFALAACGSPDARADLSQSGRVVDSILPREEAVRRFREGLAMVDSLEGGARSRDELVSAYVRAIAGADTAAIARLAVSRAEFAYLYYPTAVEGKPPYDLEPGLMWFTLYERSNEGARQAMTRYGGHPMTLVSYDCGAEEHHEGENTIYGPCTVRWRSETGDTVSVRLFSKILERAGRFKFLSYANRLG
jgi:hypothetical protein